MLSSIQSSFWQNLSPFLIHYNIHQWTFNQFSCILTYHLRDIMLNVNIFFFVQEHNSCRSWSWKKVIYSISVFAFYFNPNWCGGMFKRTYLFWKAYERMRTGKYFNKICIPYTMSCDGYKTHWCRPASKPKAKKVGLKGTTGHHPPVLFYFCNRRLATLNTRPTRSHVTWLSYRAGGRGRRAFCLTESSPPWVLDLQ